MIGFIISEYDSESEKSRWYHYDRLGNAMDITGENDEIIASYEQDAFGNVLSGSSDGYHLTTREYDSNIGFYYFYHRWYDPTLGGFLRKSLYPSHKEHPYIYCENNGILLADVKGQKGRPIAECNEGLRLSEQIAIDNCAVTRIRPSVPKCLTKANKICTCLRDCLIKKGIMKLYCCHLEVWEHWKGKPNKSSVHFQCTRSCDDGSSKCFDPFYSCKSHNDPYPPDEIF